VRHHAGGQHAARQQRQQQPRVPERLEDVGNRLRPPELIHLRGRRRHGQMADLLVPPVVILLGRVRPPPHPAALPLSPEPLLRPDQQLAEQPERRLHVQPTLTREQLDRHLAQDAVRLRLGQPEPFLEQDGRVARQLRLLRRALVREPPRRLPLRVSDLGRPPDLARD